MLVTARNHQGRPSLATLVLAMLACALASSVPAQELSPGEVSGVRVVAAPVFEASSRTVVVPATTTGRLLASFDVCTASRVGCTARLTAGDHAGHGLDVEGMTAVSGNARALTRLSGDASMLRHPRVYLYPGPADVTPAPTPVGFSSN
jgi:hypothetical protein